jgi:hypothetical protein
MTTHDLIASAKKEIKAYALSLVQSVLFWSKVSSTSADGTHDGVEGWPADGGDPGGQQPVRRGEPWGVHGRPKAGVQALVARVMGNAAAGVLTAIWTGAYGRQNLAEGETQLYCVAKDCEVYLDKNGKLRLVSSTGQDITFNGGTLKVARETDSLDVGTLGPCTAGPYPVTLSYTPTVATGGGNTGPGSPLTGPTVAVSGVVAKGTGAPNVKA